MAELKLTDEEKELSFLKLSDEDLGKYCKKAMCDLRDAHNRGEYWETLHIAAAAMLVDETIKNNAERAQFDFEGLSISNEECGDWIVEVRKK